MKKLFWLVVLGLTLILAQTSLAGGRSYVLMCKGGGGMWLAIGRQHAYIQHVRPGHNPGNPGPGECVWLDRGVRRGEIRSDGTMLLVIPANCFSSSHWPPFETVGISSSQTVFYSSDSKFNYLYNAIKNGSIFQLHVYRRDDWFNVTRIGP